MCRSPRQQTLLVLLTVAVLSLGATSCGGGGQGEPELILVGFNVPNISGVALNQPLIFTFSNDIEPRSITPDTLRVVGELGPNFEVTAVDGNLVALIPRLPNFENYSDAGLLPDVEYTVSFAIFPAPDTIRTPSGKPLLAALSFQFTTDPNPTFIEVMRPVFDTDRSTGCENNSDNVLDTSKQEGATPGARLLCFKHEGPPEVVWDLCSPQHADEAVGTPAVTPGLVNLPAIRVRLNEPLDPVTVVPYVTSRKESVNVELWLVGDTEKRPVPPRKIRVNKPLIVQSLEKTEIILVSADEDANGIAVGGVPQGTYLVNVTRNVHDLYGNELDIDGDLPPGAFAAIDAAVEATTIPKGYRIYFVTLVVPGTASSFEVAFNTDLYEYGDLLSEASEPGVFTYSLPDAELTPIDESDPMVRIPGSLETPPTLPPAGSDFPSFTLSSNYPGQSTTGNWNRAFRVMGISSLEANPDAASTGDFLSAVWKPHCGGGGDGPWTSPGGGSNSSLNTDPVTGNSSDNDGIYEFSSFNLQPNDVLNVNGSQPLVIFCRGDFTVGAGAQIYLNGSDGGPGLDTDGNVRYAHPASIPAGGVAGIPGAGGGAGGAGCNPVTGTPANGNGLPGGAWKGLFGTGPIPGGDGGFGNPTGGGGGGMRDIGLDGTVADSSDAGNAGAQSNDYRFRRDLELFQPDRTYQPYANGSGGTGGGGGGGNDGNGNTTVDNGDDGGGGGGGAGGGIYVIAGGTITVNGSILANGGNGGHTYAVSGQTVDLGDDGASGGTDPEDLDVVTGVTGAPSGAGGPGGGGTGGGIFLCGMGGVAIGGTLSAQAGSGGHSGLTDVATGTGRELVGGDASTGIIVLASRVEAIDITITGTVTPTPERVDYNPTIEFDSAGQSDWIDFFTESTQFATFRWTSNFTLLHAAGLDQGVHYDAFLEVQGADHVGSSTVDGPPDQAMALTPWYLINSNDFLEARADFDPDVPASACPIDGKRWMRFRWRFHVPDTFPGWSGGTPPVQPLPHVRSMVVEYER